MTTYRPFNYVVILSTVLATTNAIFLYHDNKQRCNCLSNSQCNQNGTCTPDECAQDYIGVTCQHANISLVSKGGYPLGFLHLTIPHQLLDGDDSTCLTQSLVSSVIYEVYKPLHFIWIFISSKSTISVTPHLTLYKWGYNLNTVSTPLQINEKSLLIKLTEDIMYDKLELSNLPKDTCSLEISLGRDLAISSSPKQSTVKTSVGSRNKTLHANLAFDGIYGTCSLTKASTHEWWKTRLLHDALVNVIQITNNKQCYNKQRVVLKLFTSDNIVTFIRMLFTMQTQTTVDNVANNNFVREVELSMSSQYQSSYCLSNGLLNLTLCEISIFGEFRCPANMYGPLCKKYCPGCNQDICDPDWGCPQGCKKDWTGDWCNTNCTNRFGPKCDLNCSTNCNGSGDCDRNTGDCLAGCKPGFQGRNCTDPCPNGRCEENEKRGGFDILRFLSEYGKYLHFAWVILLIMSLYFYRKRMLKQREEKMKTSPDIVSNQQVPIEANGQPEFELDKMSPITSSQQSPIESNKKNQSYKLSLNNLEEQSQV